MHTCMYVLGRVRTASTNQQQCQYALPTAAIGILLTPTKSRAAAAPPIYTGMGERVDSRLRESRLLTPSGRGGRVHAT